MGEEKKRKEGCQEGKIDSTVSDRSQLRAGQFGGVGWAGKEGEEPESSEATGSTPYRVRSTGTLHTLKGCGGCGGYHTAGYGVYITGYDSTVW